MLLVTLSTCCPLHSFSALFPPHLSFSIYNLLCWSCSAGQVSLVSISLSSSSDLLCHCHSPVHVSLVNVHWVFYYPLPPPFLFTPSLCCLISYFRCQRFVSPYSMLLRCFSSTMPQQRTQRVCSIRKRCVRPAASDLFILYFRSGGLFSQCCTHSVDIAISICH